MDLKEFVAETIVQIQEGVQEAIRRRSVPGSSGAINPVWGSVNEIARRDLQNVEFDVAITATETNTAGGSAGIKVFSVVQADGKASTTAEQSKVSRIKFSIPIVPPVQIVEKEKRRPGSL